MKNEITKFELPKYCTATSTSLTFAQNTPFETWEEVGTSLRQIDGAVQLWLGDWLNFGQRAYGEKYSQAMEGGNYELHTLQNYASTAGRTAVARQEVPLGRNLSMHHWDAIAALDQKEQVAFAKNAAEKDWTVLELRDAIRENKCPETPELPKGKYQVIYADPPWPYNAEQHGREAQKTVLADHYGSKSIEWLCDLPIRDLAAPNAVLFLWTTSPKIFEGAQQVIDAWGFEYKSSMVWDKVKHNVGYYVSVRHEFLLICTKGSCLPDNRKLYDSVVTVERTGHSEKPDRFYEIIEDLYHGRKIELFARKKRSGWESWGNQL